MAALAIGSVWSVAKSPAAEIGCLLPVIIIISLSLLVFRNRVSAGISRPVAGVLLLIVILHLNLEMTPDAIITTAIESVVVDGKQLSASYVSREKSQQKLFDQIDSLSVEGESASKKSVYISSMKVMNHSRDWQ